MKTYDDIELEIGIKGGEPETDSDTWSKFTQSMRREAIKDTEVQMLMLANIAKVGKLRSKPTVPDISSDILTLSRLDYRLLELYYVTSAGKRINFDERDEEWEKMRDSYNFSTLDPFYYMLGEKTYQLRHSITSPVSANYKQITIKMPQTYDASFDWGNTYSEFDGYEEVIINGATGRLLITSEEPEKASNFIAMFNEGIKLLQ